LNFILGARGRLGQAIVSSLPSDSITALPRSDYSEWWHNGAADLVSRFLEERKSSLGTIYVAAGLIDPSLSSDEHQRVNYYLARNVIMGASKLGFKVVTFGTVMETVVGSGSANSYFASKIDLGNFVENFSIKSNLVLHIRVHTLFGGGLPDRFMFLGQILHSLLSHSEFKMSPGTQLREYHHIDDEVIAIEKLLESGATGAIALSHNEPIALKDIAKYIFNAFNCSKLLSIGALSGPANDNYKVVFERPHPLDNMSFRETLPALVDYLRTCTGSASKN
jgi:nucleoside-diphosphate-sugar epimerase